MVKKTKKQLIKRQDNTRAQRLFLIFVGLQIWMLVIGSAVYIRLYISGNKDILIPLILQLSITISLVGGLLALIKELRPYHNFILIGSFMNAIFSLFEPEINYLQLTFSVIILYLGLRFPISVMKKNETRSLK